jgi:hypothetical protein
MKKLFSAATQMLVWTLYRIDKWLLPGIAISHAHRVIDRERAAKLKDEEHQQELLSPKLNGWGGASEAVRAAYDGELARRDAIERKAVSLIGASGTIFAITTAAGLLGALVPDDLSSDGRFFVAGVLFVPIICFALAFYFAINSWRVGAIAWIGPAELRAILDKPIAERDVAMATQLLLATEDNERILLKRINYLDAAERWVNRGVALGLTAGGALMLIGVLTDLLDPAKATISMP